jgi:hypothetical protein
MTPKYLYRFESFQALSLCETIQQEKETAEQNLHDARRNFSQFQAENVGELRSQYQNKAR